MLDWRRWRYSSWVINPWSRSALSVANLDMTLASAPWNPPISDGDSDRMLLLMLDGLLICGVEATSVLERPSITSPCGAAPTGTFEDIELIAAFAVPPVSRRDRFTLATWDAGRVFNSFQTTNCSLSSGRIARTASYISRAFTS